MGFWDSVNAERLLHGVEAEQLTLGHCLSARRWTVGILATSPDMFRKKIEEGDCVDAGSRHCSKRGENPPSSGIEPRPHRGTVARSTN